MGLFDFMMESRSWEERKVDRFEDKERGLVVDTCAVGDSSKPFETAVSTKWYSDGKWIVVQLYDSRQEALIGHQKWVELLTSKELPRVLEDVGDCDSASLIRAIKGTIIFERKVR